MLPWLYAYGYRGKTLILYGNININRLRIGTFIFILSSISISPLIFYIIIHNKILLKTSINRKVLWKKTMPLNTSKVSNA